MAHSVSEEHDKIKKDITIDSAIDSGGQPIPPPNAPIVRIKGRNDGIAIQIGPGDWALALAEVTERIQRAETFFRGGRVALEIGARKLSREELIEISDMLASYEIELWAVRASNKVTFHLAQEQGLATKWQTLSPEQLAATEDDSFPEDVKTVPAQDESEPTAGTVHISERTSEDAIDESLDEGADGVQTGEMDVGADVASEVVAPADPVAVDDDHPDMDIAANVDAAIDTDGAVDMDAILDIGDGARQPVETAVTGPVAAEESSLGPVVRDDDTRSVEESVEEPVEEPVEEYTIPSIAELVPLVDESVRQAALADAAPETETVDALAAEEPSVQEPEEAEEPPPAEKPVTVPFLYRGTLRSGQVVRHAGPIVVIGDVNPGAEVIGGSDVYIWGRLRGMVHAGAAGDRTAVIGALDFEPVQVRIADHIAMSPKGNTDAPGHWLWKRTSPGQPEVARLVDEQIVVDPWDVRTQKKTNAMTPESEQEE
jgi:septum site-determining protein MinC